MNQVKAIGGAMTNKIALIDLDGTLADYDKAMKRDMELIRSPFEPLEYIPHGEDEPYMRAREKLIRSQPGWWLNLEPIKSGFDVVELLKKYGFDLHILTKAPHSVSGAWSEKFLWVQKHLPEVDVTITPKKGMVYGKILFDDWAPYATDWLKHRPRGLVIMPVQRWNRYDLNDHPQVVKYDGNNLAEVEERLIKLLNSNDSELVE